MNEDTPKTIGVDADSCHTAHTAYLGLGSNLGDRHKHLEEALRLIESEIGKVERTSSFVDTAPWGFDSEHRFLNACCRISTTLSPRQLLKATQKIERTLGRTTKSTDGQYHDRTIDIDILLYDALTIDAPDLKIPHPHMEERDFVMRPLREIWP